MIPTPAHMAPASQMVCTRLGASSFWSSCGMHETAATYLEGRERGPGRSAARARVLRAHTLRARALRAVALFSTSSLARPAFLNNFVENQDFDQSKKF